MGLDPNRWLDCSGFVKYVLELSGLELAIDIGDPPRHSNEQFDSYGNFVQREMVKPGDLVYFLRRRKGYSYIGHVGIMLSADCMIHAPGYRNTHVRIEEVREEAIVNHPLYKLNPVGYKRPSLLSRGRYRVSI